MTPPTLYSSDDSKKPVVFARQARIIRRFFFNRLGIQPACNSSHELAGLFSLVQYGFANNLSAEEASSQMKTEVPDALVASADTFLRRLKQAGQKMVGKAFNSTVGRMLKGLPKQSCTMAIDYHDIPYYGNRNDPHVQGTKRQRGTNYCHQYATLEIVEGEHRLTLAVRKLSMDDDSKALVIRELVQVARKHAQPSVILLDRAFYGTECIRTLKLLGCRFVIAVPKNKAVKKAIKEHENKLPAVVKHTVGRKETFNLCMVHGEAKEKHKPRPVYCFATNIQTTDAHYIVELYRKRWSIETGYKSKKQFRCRTSSTSNIVRMLYFYLECLFYNAWYNVRTVVLTTIAGFKKTMEKMAITELMAPTTDT